MDPRAALARLAPGALDPARVGGGAPGTGLTPEDVAAAMAGSSCIGILLVRAKYSGDTSDYSRLLRVATGKARTMAGRGGWNADGERLELLAALALEHVINPRVCTHCRGVGHTLRCTLEPCRRCGGSGRSEASEASRARAFGVHPSTWSRVWRSRWRALVTALEWKEIGALQLMGDRLNG